MYHRNIDHGFISMCTHNIIHICTYFSLDCIPRFHMKQYGAWGVKTNLSQLSLQCSYFLPAVLLHSGQFVFELHCSFDGCVSLSLGLFQLLLHPPSSLTGHGSVLLQLLDHCTQVTLSRTVSKTKHNDTN